MKTKTRRVVMRMERNKCVQEKKADEMWPERQVGIKHGNKISGWVYRNRLSIY